MSNDSKFDIQAREFKELGFRAGWYGLIGRVFRSRKYLNKSVDCLDIRWEMMNMRK